jgi:hypothetical protein
LLFRLKIALSKKHNLIHNKIPYRFYLARDFCYVFLKLLAYH